MMKLLVCCMVLYFGTYVLADKGTIQNCGGSKFAMEWSPAKLNKGETITITASGKANEEFVQGTANVSVWIKADPPILFIQNSKPVKCSEAIPFAKGLLKCPVQPGTPLNVKDLSIKVPDDISKAPPGEYIVQLELKNASGKMFLCVKADISVNI